MVPIAMLSVLTGGCEFGLFVPAVLSALARVAMSQPLENEGAVPGMFAMLDHWVIKWLQVYIFLSAGMSSKFGSVPALVLSGEL